MATADKQTQTPAPEWWKHLRPENKRVFWKKVRGKFKVLLRREQD